MMETSGFDSKYRMIVVAARRARQLQSGARPAVETSTQKACKVAQQEIKAGKVKWSVPEPERSAVDVANELLNKALSGEPSNE